MGVGLETACLGTEGRAVDQRETGQDDEERGDALPDGGLVAGFLRPRLGGFDPGLQGLVSLLERRLAGQPERQPGVVALAATDRGGQQKREK